MCSSLSPHSSEVLYYFSVNYYFLIFQLLIDVCLISLVNNLVKCYMFVDYFWTDRGLVKYRVKEINQHMIRSTKNNIRFQILMAISDENWNSIELQSINFYLIGPSYYYYLKSISLSYLGCRTMLVSDVQLGRHTDKIVGQMVTRDQSTIISYSRAIISDTW